MIVINKSNQEYLLQVRDLLKRTEELIRQYNSLLSSEESLSISGVIQEIISNLEDHKSVLDNLMMDIIDET